MHAQSMMYLLDKVLSTSTYLNTIVQKTSIFPFTFSPNPCSKRKLSLSLTGGTCEQDLMCANLPS